MLTYNPNSFLSGDEAFVPARDIEIEEQRVQQELVFDIRHEGLIGIPHGGLVMGLCLDAWRRSRVFDYPVDVKVKFGGSGVKIGDACLFSVECAPEDEKPGVVARITKEGDKTPYVRADITSSSTDDPATLVPESPDSDFRKLPYYRNCFVCGHHREMPGLKRRFRVHDPASKNVITSRWAAEDEDVDRARHFLIEKDELHPGVLTAIFDENTAWAGFMVTRSCGLSVRMNFTLLRPVKKTEELLFVGWPTGTRGNPRQPRFFMGGGTVLSMTDPGNPEPVMYGRGEWIIRNEYTDQIKTNLLPRDDWQWIFGEDPDEP